MKESEPLLQQCIYLVNAQDQIVSVNSEWNQFANSNDALKLNEHQVLGKVIWQFFCNDQLIHLFELIHDRVRKRSTSISLLFRCDSPSVKRSMRMELIPREQNSIEYRITYLQIEERTSIPLLERKPSGMRELITICSWCKKVKHENDWLELEDYCKVTTVMELEDLPNLTHGICSNCLQSINQTLDEDC